MPTVVGENGGQGSISLMTAEKTWRDYQEKAAAFFRRLGLNAQVEFSVEGARGIHKVDVYVEGSLRGIAFKWIIECKAWKTNVPKEKVMALACVVQDVGADRGFLLSEVGFQSGALRVARKTNITLTSLEDLATSSDEFLLDSIIGRLHWRLDKARHRIVRTTGKSHLSTLEHIGGLVFLDLALHDALTGKYPRVYRVEGSQRFLAHTLDELLQVADEMISELEAWEPPEES